jgi:hypothetical protein
MAQIFHRSTNTISRVTIIGTLLLVAGFFWWVAQMQRSSYTTYRGIAHTQPVPFSHQHHVSGLGLDCRYCHTAVEVSSFAGIPPTKTCMNCHSEIWTNAPMLEPVRQSFQTGRSLQWTRVNDLPDYVYFDHSIHLAKGVGCDTCHGPVQRMPLMVTYATLQMEWCLNCHRAPQKYLRPREEVFNLNWQPPSSGQPVTMDGIKFTDQIAFGNYLLRKYRVRSVQDITSCDTCHR